MDSEREPDTIHFDEIAEIIHTDFEKHKKVIHDCCVKSSIIPLSEYNDALQEEYKSIESCTTPRRDKPSPLEYIELFKAFDDYPSNLPKPKKQLSREISRSHLAMKSSKSNTSSTSMNSSKLFEDQPSAAVVCNEFDKFTEKLSNFQKELADQANSTQYDEKLESINTFARDLEKLSQSEDDGIDAFTKDEEAKIKTISENVEHFALIQENQDLCNNLADNEPNSARLNDLIDIVTDALVAVNCYKP